MDANLVDRKTNACSDKVNLNRNTGESYKDSNDSIGRARADLDKLEKSYRKSSRTLQSLVLGMFFAVLVFMAFGLFGTKLDREKFTTDVTPVHIEVNAISEHRQTAANPRNLQM
ncbi:MAG TPA: hypothetical protein V6C89_16455 [Drouetiella sp.]|jgi:hypothetical protein